MWQPASKISREISPFLVSSSGLASPVSGLSGDNRVMPFFFWSRQGLLCHVVTRFHLPLLFATFWVPSHPCLSLSVHRFFLICSREGTQFFVNPRRRFPSAPRTPVPARCVAWVLCFPSYICLTSEARNSFILYLASSFSPLVFSSPYSVVSRHPYLHLRRHRSSFRLISIDRHPS